MYFFLSIDLREVGDFFYLFKSLGIVDSSLLVTNQEMIVVTTVSSCPHPVCRICSSRHVRYFPFSHLSLFQNHASRPKIPSFHLCPSCHLRLAPSSFSVESGTPGQSRSGQLSPPEAGLPSRARNCPDRNTGSGLSGELSHADFSRRRPVP